MAIYEKAQGHWVSMAIYTACYLGLADHLGSKTKSIRDLATLTGSDEDNLYRLMRALSGEGIFREHPGKRFSNTRLSHVMMEGMDTSKYLLLHQFNPDSKVYLRNLPEVIRAPRETREVLHGKVLFNLMRDDPEKNEIYNKSMDQGSEMIALAVLSAYDFDSIDTLIDIGGGRGVLLSRILEVWPGMKGVLFDLPHVSAPAEANFLNNGTRKRIEIISGDFFEDLPVRGDAYFLKNILHAFGDQDCINLLKKIAEVMAPEGKIIILETLLKPDNKPAFGKLFDLLMMAGTQGGKERTREEFESLFEASGLRISRIIRTVAPFSIIETVKR
jgi:ubiquinone/menaquinone biosynthesis C-methylase UbiE